MSINAAFADRVPEHRAHEQRAQDHSAVGHHAPDHCAQEHRAPDHIVPARAPFDTRPAASLLEAELERWYTQERGWPVERDGDGRLWLPAGAQFDVVEVPEEAGRRALRRLIDYGQAALAPGPVALSPAGRCGFFVAPGARDDLPELLDWLDWGGIDLGLRARGAGDRVPAPSRDRWLHDPLAVPPEVIALLATIAESCSRYALTHRAV